MNIDNQLLLGIVFITAGVAMGLLAYAAFLNRQEAEEEELAEDIPEEESEPLPAQEAAEQPEPEPPSEESETAVASEQPTAPPPEPLAQPEAIVGTEADAITGPDSQDQAPVPPPEPTVPSSAPPATPAEPPTVLVDRDSATDRLMVRVDDRIYHSMEELQASEDWSRVTGLFSDLLAWMIKGESIDRDEEEGESEETISKPISMVQEINAILSEKLTGRDSGPQAVRLMEGAGGSIRVYIGVESYSIEEVPDEQVKALIRQAVAEWEARQ